MILLEAILLLVFGMFLKWMDCMTTHALIAYEGDLECEKNPIARYLMKKFGFLQTLLLFMGIHTAGLAVFTSMAVLGDYLLYVVVNIVMMAVVINNLIQMKKAGAPFKLLIGNHFIFGKM